MSHNTTNRIICFSLIFLLLFSFCSCRNFEIDVHMFSDIEECNKIVSSKENEVQIKYLSIEEDKNSKDLNFDKFFGCEYISKQINFKIFAYVFENDDIAMQYFYNETGIKTELNPTFNSSSGMFWFERIVVKDNKAYLIRCKKEYEEKVIEFINSCFKEEIIKTNND